MTKTNTECRCTVCNELLPVAGPLADRTDLTCALVLGEDFGIEGPKANDPARCASLLPATRATISRRTRDRIVRDHGIVDSKGRKVGGYATLRTYSENSYLVTTFATRDGEQFGSSFPSGTVVKGDIEAARALAEKKLDAQGRRQAKAHAAPAAPKASPVAAKADNPSCPKCGRYNAMLRGFTQLACRDCGHTMPLA